MLSEGDDAYTYNLNGDTESITHSSGDVTRLHYDEFGNLNTVELPSEDRIDYLVDGQNRRRVKEKNGEKFYSLLYKDQLNPVALLDKDDNILMRFVYGSKAHVPDYMIAGGEKYRILSDHLGSVRLVIQMSTGEVVQRLDYGPWGEVLEDTNPGFQPFGFAGGLYDHETGFVRFGARDYNPETGRWMQKDPIGFAGGDVNLYRYVGNDPVNNIDPTGKILPAVAAVYIAGEVGFFIGATCNKISQDIPYSKTYEDAHPGMNLINGVLPGTNVISDPNTQKIIRDGLNNQRIEDIDAATNI